MMASAGAVLSGIMWLQQLHDHRWVAPVPYGPRPRSNAQPNRPSIDYATALGRRPRRERRGLLLPRDIDGYPSHETGQTTLDDTLMLPRRSQEVVPGVVELEVAVPRLRPAKW